MPRIHGLDSSVPCRRVIVGNKIRKVCVKKSTMLPKRKKIQDDCLEFSTNDESSTTTAKSLIYNKGTNRVSLVPDNSLISRTTSQKLQDQCQHTPSASMTNGRTRRRRNKDTKKTCGRSTRLEPFLQYASMTISPLGTPSSNNIRRQDEPPIVDSTTTTSLTTSPRAGTTIICPTKRNNTLLVTPSPHKKRGDSKNASNKKEKKHQEEKQDSSVALESLQMRNKMRPSRDMKSNTLVRSSLVESNRVIARKKGGMLPQEELATTDCSCLVLTRNSRIRGWFPNFVISRHGKANDTSSTTIEVNISEHGPALQYAYHDSNVVELVLPTEGGGGWSSPNGRILQWEAYILDLLHKNNKSHTVHFPKPLHLSIRSTTNNGGSGYDCFVLRTQTDEQREAPLRVFGTLCSLLEKCRQQHVRLPESTVAWIALQVLGIVTALHANHVTHNHLTLQSFVLMRRTDDGTWHLHCTGLGVQSLVLIPGRGSTTTRRTATRPNANNITNDSCPCWHYQNDLRSIARITLALLSGRSVQKEVNLEKAPRLDPSQRRGVSREWDRLLSTLWNAPDCRHGAHGIEWASIDLKTSTRTASWSELTSTCRKLMRLKTTDSEAFLARRVDPFLDELIQQI